MGNDTLGNSTPSSRPGSDTIKNESQENIESLTKVPAKFVPTTQFWLVWFSMCVTVFLSALELTALSVVLPTIVEDLGSTSDEQKSDGVLMHGDTSSFAWIGSAYVLTSTAFIPIFGSLAHIFGRRVGMLASIILFAIGSAICGAAPTINALIAGRAIQGAGGGGILALCEILAVDLVPLSVRGIYMGIIGFVWAVASAIGPPIGGAFGERQGLWRWLFYLNLPLCGIAALLVFLFLRVPVPQTTWEQKRGEIDYALLLFVGASVAATLGLSWAGSTYSWGSYQVLVSLIVGIAGLAAFIFIEFTCLKNHPNPTVPYSILNNTNSIFGYVTNFLHGVGTIAAVYYFPVYFQALQGASPVQSGVRFFSIAFTVAPAAIFCGAIVTITKKYVLINWIGWGFFTLGFGLMSLLNTNSPARNWIGIPIVAGIGAGLLYSAPLFAILGPLAPEHQPRAMAFHAFTRAFGNVFGVTVGATVIQSHLTSHLPDDFMVLVEGSASAAYGAIPYIKTLPEPLQTSVKHVFSDALQKLWYVCCGIAGLGLLVSLTLKHYDMAETVDETWKMEERKK